MRLVDAHLAMDIADAELIDSSEIGSVHWVLSHTPTINPKDLIPKGRWIKIHEVCGIEVLECSVCHGQHPRLRTAFCCDCGADMRETT